MSVRGAAVNVPLCGIMRSMNADSNSHLLTQELTHFTGTSAWYRTERFPDLAFTDGVKHFLDRTGAVEILQVAAKEGLKWLADKGMVSLVFSFTQNEGGHILIQDGNYNPLVSRKASISGLPLGIWEFWLADGVLYLPSEH